VGQVTVHNLENTLVWQSKVNASELAFFENSVFAIQAKHASLCPTLSFLMDKVKLAVAIPFVAIAMFFSSKFALAVLISFGAVLLYDWTSHYMSKIEEKTPHPLKKYLEKGNRICQKLAKENQVILKTCKKVEFDSSEVFGTHDTEKESLITLTS